MQAPVAAQFHFGCVFTLCGTDGASPSWNDLTRAVQVWIGAKHGNTRDLAHPRFYLGGEWRPLGRERVVVTTERALGSGREEVPEFWAVRYEHPCDEVYFRQWRTDIGITALQDGSFRFALSTIHWLLPGYIGEEPAAPVPTAPRIVSTLVDSPTWSAFAGTERLRTKPEVLMAGAAPGLVDRIQSSRRLSPIVLATREFDTGRLKLDTVRLSRLLAGTATVVEVASTAIDKELEWFLPEPFRCWNGMVRIYQPAVRLDRAPDAKRHRFFKRDHIDALTPDAVEGMIVRGIARRSRSLAADGVLVTIDDVIAKQRESRLAELRQLTDDKALREQLAIQGELLEAADEDHKTLSGQIRELQAQLEEAEEGQADLQDEVASLSYEKEQLRRAAGEAEGRVRQMQAQRATLTSLRSLPQSLPEIVGLVERFWPDRIVFTDRAKASAKRAGVNKARSDLDEAWRCLWAMATDLHEILFSDTGAKGDVAQRFLDRSGFEVTLTEGKQTKNDKNLMKLRKLKYMGAEVDITPHVKYGSKAPKCLRVHFYADHEKKVVVVGHCGDHLDTYGSQWIS